MRAHFNGFEALEHIKVQNLIVWCKKNWKEVVIGHSLINSVIKKMQAKFMLNTISIWTVIPSIRRIRTDHWDAYSIILTSPLNEHNFALEMHQ